MAWFRRRVLSDQERLQAALDKQEKSNRGIVRAAHTFAFLLVIATSVASLISLAGAIIQRIVTTGADIPTSASVAITFLLVLAMDTGSIYAAIMIRIARQRRQPWQALAMHLVVLLVVSALEAGTYIYMLVLYEHPHDPASWALVVARGLAEPLLAIYLVMASEITITPADIALQAELVTGVAVLRDLVTQASDPTRSLADKIAMYGAAAELTDDQRQRLKLMYLAVQTRDTRIVDADPPPPDSPPEPPRGLPAPSDEPILADVRTPKRTAPKTPPKRPQTADRKKRLALVRAMLDEDAETSVTAIAKRLNVSRGAAHSLQLEALSERMIMLADDRRPRRRA